MLADGRVALVVGNSTYAHIGRLPNPDNDARDMSAGLRRLGFEVTTELDADRVELTEALRAFTRRSAGADVSLVFYTAALLSHLETPLEIGYGSVGYGRRCCRRPRCTATVARSRPQPPLPILSSSPRPCPQPSGSKAHITEQPFTLEHDGDPATGVSRRFAAEDLLLPPSVRRAVEDDQVARLCTAPVHTAARLGCASRPRSRAYSTSRFRSA